MFTIMHSTGRKKQPDRVRSQLLEATALVTAERGLAAVTLDEVARRAGVSKGGLLHHFSTRQILLTAMYEELLNKLAEIIRQYMDTDTQPSGKFTRAYVMAITGNGDDADANRNLFHGSPVSMMAMDPILSPVWASWIRSRLDEAPPEDRSVKAGIIRLAADGIWVDDYAATSALTPEERQKALDMLVLMTKTL